MFLFGRTVRATARTHPRTSSLISGESLLYRPRGIRPHCENLILPNKINDKTRVSQEVYFLVRRGHRSSVRSTRTAASYPSDLTRVACILAGMTREDRIASPLPVLGVSVPLWCQFFRTLVGHGGGKREMNAFRRLPAPASARPASQGPSPPPYAFSTFQNTTAGPRNWPVTLLRHAPAGRYWPNGMYGT